ncbi:MAG TPA: hypothetical protein VMF11_10255 [Candidatus Baltobacteraceae bacterium]|nr:hypothetical protein [Candidatus Baltobacteraceae bacterium]
MVWRAAAALVLAWFICAAPARSWATGCIVAIPATMVDTVDSGTAFPGMEFRFKLAVTARIDNVLIPQGTIGYGVVREVTAASNHDRNGSLVLEVRELVYNNKPYQVMIDPRDASVWAPAETLAERATGYLPIPGLVRTAVNEVRSGKNVKIGPGFMFHIVALGTTPKTLAPCHKIGN